MGFFEQVHALVMRIPPGRVSTYGGIAHMLGQPYGARTVGWALRGIPEGSAIPWHRVVSAAGRISIAGRLGAAEQRRRLEAEGVCFGPDDRIDLRRFGWVGLTWPEVQELLAECNEDD